MPSTARANLYVEIFAFMSYVDYLISETSDCSVQVFHIHVSFFSAKIRTRNFLIELNLSNQFGYHCFI